MTENKDNARGSQPTDDSEAGIRRLMHDLKQPLNAISVIAQELRHDANKDRLDSGSIPTRMKEIESAVKELVGRLDDLRVVLQLKRNDKE